MKKNTKTLILIYTGVALFAYLLSFTSTKLESREDLRNRNESIVLRAK